MRAGPLAGFVVAALAAFAPASADAQQDDIPAFRSGVDLVTVSAVVRDSNGRLVSTLERDDFQLLDDGQPRDIAEFRREETPISLGVLLDVSGSMSMLMKREAAREAAHHLLSWLRPGVDEVALFTFDTRLTEVVPFTTTAATVRAAVENVTPFGATSLRDAIAATAERVVARGKLRRAVVVLTDGLDTASQLTASEVSGIASAIDVPVYIMALASATDASGREFSVAGDVTQREIDVLSDLARWTGGALMVAGASAHSSTAARQIVTELRYQYFIAFEPSTTPGWHPLELRLRDRDLTVRARSGYFAGQTGPMN